MNHFDKYQALADFNAISIAAADNPVEQLRLPQKLADMLQGIYEGAYEAGFKAGLDASNTTIKTK